MGKTVTVRAMIDPKKKERVSKILSRLGINHSEAINIYYSLIEEYKGLPFDLKLPEKISENKNVNQEIMQHLKESVKKNYHLGELLAE
jgi:DNA-damage-inducible protein J